MLDLFRFWEQEHLGREEVMWSRPLCEALIFSSPCEACIIIYGTIKV